jgi:hypothetical protein
VITAQDAGESGFGNWESHHNLSIGTALAAEVEDLGFELWSRSAGLANWSRGMVLETLGQTGCFGVSQPRRMVFSQTP